MLTTIHDHLTGQTHRVQSPRAYVRQLEQDKARLHEDLSGPCRNDQWRADRIEALAWTERELARLGHGPTA